MALQFYNEAIQLCPEIAAYYCNRALVLIMMTDFSAALQDSLAAIERDYRSKSGYECIIVCYLTFGDLAGAEQAIAKLIEIVGNNETCAHYVEQFNRLKSSIEMAMQCFDRRDFLNSGMF